MASTTTTTTPATQDDIRTLIDCIKFRAQHQGQKAAFIFRHEPPAPPPPPPPASDSAAKPTSPTPTPPPPQGSQQHLRYVQTFESIYRLGGRFSAVLKSGGVGKGHLVVNTLPNCPERVIAEAGIILCGAASVNAQCLLADGSDLLATIRDSRASAVLLDPGVIHSPWHVLRKHVSVGKDGEAGVDKMVVDVVHSTELPDLKKVIFAKRGSSPTSAPSSSSSSSKEKASNIRSNSQDDFLTKLGEGDESCAADWFVADDVSDDDTCSVFTTSGSTGFCKLVSHTHGGMVEAALRVNPITRGLTGQEVEFSMAPLGWLGGYVGNTLLTGNTRVLADTYGGLPRDLVQFMLQAFLQEHVALTFIPAPRLPLFVDAVRKLRESEGKVVDPDNPGTSLQLLERLTLGGQPVTRSLVHMASLLARKVFVLYGSTETFVMSSFTVPDPKTYQDFDCGTVVTPGGELKVVSMAPGREDENQALPPGQTGIILFKRPRMMRGYLHNPEATAEAFTKDGFFRTGDVGKVGEDGHVLVEGRGNDAIMRGPYIFYPGWLEERIRACPAVRDVMVVGVPDPAANEELCACVTLTSEEASMSEVKDFVEKDIVMTASDDEPMSPKPRHYLSFDAFPLTSTGKPNRTVIKKEASQRLSVSSDD